VKGTVETARTSEISVSYHTSTLRHNPNNHDLDSYS